MIYGAYCTCHPSDGIRYVGQTSKSLNSRAYNHLWCARTPESKSYRSFRSNWIRRHREENIRFKILEECSDEELDSLEKEWIAKLRAQGNRLTNIKSGGSSERGYKSPRQSESMKGDKNPMYGRDRKAEMAYARSFMKPMTDEARAKVSERSRGEKNVKAKLKESDILKIRARDHYYGVNADLGREYGVSAQTISQIRSGKIWKHIAP